jgi:hypothetical protein
MVHMPCDGPAPANFMLPAVTQTMPSPHCASDEHMLPSADASPLLPPPVFPPDPLPPRPIEPEPARPAPPPGVMKLPPPGAPVVPSSLPQLAVAAIVPTETKKSVNQVLPLTTEAS